jgi:tRNA U34 5-methylaminomethyl-2-thiouridine-forming methyltransferase MnmC
MWQSKKFFHINLKLLKKNFCYPRATIVTFLNKFAPKPYGVYNLDMYELYPYFTNDSTVGLFSRQDDDIYHSTYGALSESWQKFIVPSGLEKYMQEHKGVKILDIGYGIGYNTKTSLQVFIRNFLKQKINSKKNIKINKKSGMPHSSIAAIGTDNITTDKNLNSYGKNHHAFSHLVPICIAEIDTNNAERGNGERFCVNNENIYTKDENIYVNSNVNSDFDSDSDLNTNENKDSDFESDYSHFGYDSIYNPDDSYSGNSKINYCNNLLIDAVDLDKTLIYLSPFIAEASKFNYLFQNDYEISSLDKSKYNQIQNIKSHKKFIRKEFNLRKEVSIILFKKLLGNNPDFFNDVILQTILNHKKYAPFLSRFMVNFAKFYLNRGYNYNKKQKKTTFLHNIYYRYLSRSYKNAKSLLKNCKIKVNLHKNDARSFIKSSNTTYNFIFLDAFTPAKCPALWTIQFLGQLYNKLEDDGIILTYSNSAAVRNAFLQNGFSVGKIYDEKLKRFVGTIATKNRFLTQYPLDELDMNLINSKAGIPFKDENLDLDNDSILENRRNEVKESTLRSSSQILRNK